MSSTLKSCLMCPKGTACCGYVLHTLILKLYEAMEVRGCTASIVRELTREDMLLFAKQGAQARATCWTKGFVLAMGRRLANMAAQGTDEITMRRGIEHLIVQMDSLFAKLPAGIHVDIMDLSMEVFNQACEDMRELGSGAVVPANILGQAYASASKRKMRA